MIHFRRVGRVDIAPVLPMLVEHASLFDAETWRQEHPDSPHSATRAIFLRMPPVIDPSSVFESLEVEDRPALAIPVFAELVAAMGYVVEAHRLARVMLVELKAGGHIKPHWDAGAYAEATERYHLAITTNPRCVMQVGEERLHIAPGDVWWMDKHTTHFVLNSGTSPRVHLIMDVFA